MLLNYYSERSFTSWLSVSSVWHFVHFTSGWAKGFYLKNKIFAHFGCGRHTWIIILSLLDYWVRPNIFSPSFFWHRIKFQVELQLVWDLRIITCFLKKNLSFPHYYISYLNTVCHHSLLDILVRICFKWLRGMKKAHNHQLGVLEKQICQMTLLRGSQGHI